MKNFDLLKTINKKYITEKFNSSLQNDAKQESKFTRLRNKQKNWKRQSRDSNENELKRILDTQLENRFGGPTILQ
jgi:uncharacterized protein YjiS (DUF1127 family)